MNIIVMRRYIVFGIVFLFLGASSYPIASDTVSVNSKQNISIDEEQEVEQMNFGFNNGEPPEFTNLELQQSIDQTTWNNVPGNLTDGFTMTLNPTYNYYYLTLKNPETQTNIPLMEDYFGFYLNTSSVPDEFYPYWVNRGVYEGCSGTWEPIMWQIINGTLPMYFIRVSEGQEFMLVDGLQKAIGQGDYYLRVNGDYPIGTYSFSGTIISEQGVPSELIIVEITFEGITPKFLSLELQQSIDLVSWTDVSGNLIDGFNMLLDPDVEYYYLTLKNPETQTNIPLQEGYHPFYVNTYPPDFFTYWENRGVHENANPGTWQEHMWHIINADEPIFYIHVDQNQHFTLIDGLVKDWGGTDTYLRINGDYLKGAYTYSGKIISVQGVESEIITVGMTFSTFVHMGIVLSDNTVTVGEEIVATVYIDTTEPIGGWLIQLLSFTPSVVNAIEVLPGLYWDEFFDEGDIDNTVGTITGIQTWSTGPYPESNHTACNIRFTSLHPGECVIELQDVEITNTTFDLLPILTHKITLTVTTAPFMYNEQPLTGSLNVPRPPSILSAIIEDPNGDPMDIHITWKNHEGEWVELASFSDVGNGTYSFTPPYENEWIWGDTVYVWSINVTDGTFWTNQTFSFTTMGSRYDVNNNGRVNYQDAGLVWIHRTSEVEYDGLFDVDQNGIVNYADAGLTWVNRD
jgi:hypothetical protein